MVIMSISDITSIASGLIAFLSLAYLILKG